MDVEKSTVDPRIRRYVPPVRVVWHTSGTAAPENPEALLSLGRGACTLRYEKEAPGILLDFGREIHGGVQIENGGTPEHCPVRVRVRFGESVSEAMGEPNNDHAIHDHIAQVPWYGAAEIGNTGFRFVRIDLVDPGARIEIVQLRAVFLYRDLEYKGSFHSSDDRLNRIWQVGAYTVHLCMQDMLWDGIKRDRLVWLGDMHPETMVISTVFGEVDIVPKSLDFVRDRTPLPGWMNGISSYSLWWVLIQHCWHLYHGNRGYLEEQRGYLLGLLSLLCTQVDGNNRECLGEHRFLDWPSSGQAEAIHAGLHALLCMALRAGAGLAGVLDEFELRGQCNTVAARLEAHSPPKTSSKQANALLALAGLADAAETNRTVLAEDPLQGLSTFYGYYVLEARALAGDYQGCLEVIRTYWGAMLDLGATTFWEDFQLGWTENAARIDGLVPPGKKDIHADFGDYCYKGLRHSLCHGWAAGPTAWLSEYVLGCKPLEPGSRKLLVQPHLGDLEFAEGTFPTPAGVVKISHKKTASGNVETSVEAPDEIRVLRHVRT